MSQGGDVETMEQATSDVIRDDTYEQDLIKRRSLIAGQFLTLPPYGSKEFWQRIEESQSQQALPLEVLVKCVRVAIRREDDAIKKRILELIFRRIQAANEYWSKQILLKLHLPIEEQSMCAHDLYADLCERVIRAMYDEKRQFWEENFQHCLSFERKHTYQAFMTREGRWFHGYTDGPDSRRIPRSRMDSLDHPTWYANGEAREMEIVDEQAQLALLAVERQDLPLLIVDLPEKLKSVIWLLFWGGKTEKHVASILGISDRTVRNRLQKALAYCVQVLSLREQPFMDNEHEEMIERLTARYVADNRAGYQPQLSEYLSRYPQYADMLIDFVTYYHAVEIDLPLEGEIIAQLSQTSRAAFDEAMEKVECAGVELNGKPGALRLAADNAHQSLNQVSKEIGLDEDILYQLDQRRIHVATIPHELSRRLAKSLHQPVAALEMMLGLNRHEPHLQLVAEQPSDYHVEGQHGKHELACSFQEAIERSEHISAEQKGNWMAILLQEGLL
jgi:Sigma-70, region 4